ncbi:conserved hypothetical protein [Candidatus Zixiibacteriota bacterium]|nr:conserved hypothetical protein [candidate division Zixibacteria bacterium]
MTKYKNIERLLKIYGLVLASGSPRRVDILNKAGIAFRQIIPNLDEKDDVDPDPCRLSTILAEAKAHCVMNQAKKNEIVLGCDTIVILNGRILGKPRSARQASQMLTALSGAEHTVCSAIALVDSGGKTVAGFETTKVYFNEVSAEAIREYIDTGEPMDKAGAYGIQGKGGFLVDRIVGNIDNVTGLPMTLLDSLAGKWQKN